MRRREFITLLGGAVAAWPLSGRAQQPDRRKRIGVLMGLVQNDPSSRPYIVAFESKLQSLGWTSGQNLEIDYRWTGGDAERFRTDAAELAKLDLDAILATSTGALQSLQRATKTAPIVFVQVTNPDSGGFVASLERPGGNITGVSNPDVSIVGDRLKMLKEIAPKVARALAIFEPDYPTVPSSLLALESAAAQIGVRASSAGARDAAGIDKAIREFAREPNGGLLVIQSPPLVALRERTVALAADQGLPGVYPLRSYAASGGLASYGNDLIVIYAQAAALIDRILKGEKPGEISVQPPAKFEVVINLKTAKTLGIEIPPAVMARATDVIR
jgi:putative ABC transport system substrate-binding protein